MARMTKETSLTGLILLYAPKDLKSFVSQCGLRDNLSSGPCIRTPPALPALPSVFPTCSALVTGVGRPSPMAPAQLWPRLCQAIARPPWPALNTSRCFPTTPGDGSLPIIKLPYSRCPWPSPYPYLSGICCSCCVLEEKMYSPSDPLLQPVFSAAQLATVLAKHSS